jgi:hypothetical protein
MSRARHSDDVARYSGQLRLRMPAGLHRDIAFAAAREGVSMNQFICTVMAGAVGWTAIALEEKMERAKPATKPIFNFLSVEEVDRLLTPDDE